MIELDSATIIRRSVHGIFALISRTIFIQVIALVAQVLFGFFLEPNVYGVYAIVQAVIAFLMYFSDIGLAAALIQKKEDITKDDLKTAFTIQQGLVFTVVLIALFSSGFVASFYDLNRPGIFLFQALVVSFFLSSLKTIPSVLLERNLDFHKLVIPQIAETLVFYPIAVILAIQGFGITSFTFAVLARGIVGLIVMYIVRPWKPAIGIEKASAKKLLSFGLPFQSNSILALFKDDFLTIILGKILTFSEVGYITFSQRWAYMPLRLALDNVIRITFPSFSRLQHDKRLLRSALEKSIFIIVTIVAPLLTGLTILAPALIHMLPKYLKWEPALVSLVFFSLTAILSSVSTPLTNFLNAIGKIKITLMFMLFWTIATWVATFLGIHFFGFTGVSIGAFVVSLSVVIVIFVTKKYVDFSIKRAAFAPCVATATMGIVTYILSQIIVNNLPTLFLAIILSGLVYILILYILAKEDVKRDIILIRQILKKE